ncbi:TetR family transcriptional regulator [Hypnocyclicus thermotrophus]|uniref:TetR family transcriptional regulator n=1 Tax=Hypnocyclicus thermotrophus TaxID=1627895 RepID=A0AA46I5J9_9FUSO|nr:TetR/AcrR family transcriptional regulator [Hypnocyclicus thermotrophus]TDT69885.1 TetR family transcriptional regulator [Hypnocyclicus thermotrophus]
MDELNTKNKLIKSAMELFLEKGYEGIKVEDITKEAGVAKGTFYTYFKAKDDIFIDVISKMMEIYIDILKNLKFEEGELKKNIKKIVSLMYKTSYKHKAMYKVISLIFKNPHLLSKLFESEFPFKKMSEDIYIKLLESSKNEVRDEVIENKKIFITVLGKILDAYMFELFEIKEFKSSGKIKKITEEELEYHIKIISNTIYLAIKK